MGNTHSHDRLNKQAIQTQIHLTTAKLSQNKVYKTHKYKMKDIYGLVGNGENKVNRYGLPIRFGF